MGQIFILDGVRYESWCCSECSNIGMMRESYLDARRSDGKTFYCSYCKSSQVFNQGKSSCQVEAERLKKERDDLLRQKQNLLTERTELLEQKKKLQTTVNIRTSEVSKLEKSVNSYKLHLKKAKKHRK